jgi:hypothetical protein
MSVNSTTSTSLRAPSAFYEPTTLRCGPLMPTA